MATKAIAKRVKAQQGRFLECFKEAGNITKACQAAGISRSTHYEWIKKDPPYAQAFWEADEELTDEIEESVLQSVREGDEIVVGRTKDGQPITIFRKSDALRIFILKARKPWKYRERMRDAREMQQFLQRVADVIVRYISEDQVDVALEEIVRATGISLDEDMPMLRAVNP